MAVSRKTHLQTNDAEILLRPIIHVTQPGPENRNLMKQFVLACNYWIKCPKDKQKIYGDIANTFHDITIVLDDLEDKTILRRGIPAAHIVYGVPLSIQSTVHMAILLFQDLLYYLEDRKDVVTDGFIRAGIELFTGQGVEIYYRDIGECPTFDDYRVIVYGKSVGTFIWAIQTLQLFAKQEEIKFSDDFSDKIAHFLQIYDDYINLHNPKYATVRIYCDDLDEGKFSFPIIHAIQGYRSDHRLLNMLRNRPLDIETKKQFVDIMESFGSFEYTRNVLKNLKNSRRC